MSILPIALTHITLIDGTGRPPRENAVLVLRQGRVDAVADAAQWQPPEGEPMNVLDLRGQTVLPGLIDSHVHLAMDGPADSKLEGETAWTTLLMLKHAQNHLAAGFTTVRDVGGRHGLEFSVRRAIEQGLWAGPRMQLAGKLLSITSAGAPYYDGMYREADGVEEVRKAAREQLKAGADLIKVLATGAVLTPGEQPGAVQYNRDEIAAAVEEAGKVGKGVAAHAHGVQGIRNAVNAGVRTVEHGTYLHHDERLMETMAERGIFLVPTLKPGFDVLFGDRPGVPDWIREKLKVVQEDAMRSVQRALQMGIPIAMGSDAATPYNYHGDNAMELVWLGEAGMSPLQVIVAATANAARALGWDSWLGTLEPGNIADLIVVEGNPLENLRVLADRRNIRLVFKEGQLVAQPQHTALSHVPETLLAGAWICCGLPENQHYS
jgi:imidazolonepropionase-like amidohydrolase